MEDKYYGGKLRRWSILLIASVGVSLPCLLKRDKFILPMHEIGTLSA
jgi:hypothetical protein